MKTPVTEQSVNEKLPTVCRIYFLEGKEVHMLGDYVGVVWNTRQETKTDPCEHEGETCQKTTTVTVRDFGPYIDFLWIRETDGRAWEDEDSPVAGGLSPEEARDVAVELAAAAAYLEKQ